MILPSAAAVAAVKSSPQKVNYAFHDIPREKPGYNISLWGGQAVKIIGSSERRSIFGISWAYSEDCAKLRFRGYPAVMRYEFGLDFSHGSGARSFGPTDRGGFWILPEVRWRGRPKHRTGLFLGLGLGLYFSDPTVDLNSYINTMPTLDVGVYNNTGKCEWQVGLRWRHSSNGGTKKPNDGQNAILLFVGFRL